MSDFGDLTIRPRRLRQPLLRTMPVFVEPCPARCAVIDRCLFITGILVCTLATCCTHADVHSYRYSLNTKSGDPRFSGDIKVGAESIGPRIDVEADAKGRIVKVAYFQYGKKTGEQVFHFPAGANFADSFDEYRDGKHTARCLIERDSVGQRTRTEQRTAEGRLTRYVLLKRDGDQLDRTVYNAESKNLAHWILFFTPDGLEKRCIRDPEGNSTTDENIDPYTGLSQSRLQSAHGKTVARKKFTYDANGNELREDFYNEKDQLYGGADYTDGLKTHEVLNFHNGDTLETNTSYDDNRQATEAKFFRNNQLVCVFSFDRYPTGIVKRTVAKGPDGTMYAEYPDHYVDSVKRDGSPPADVSGTVFYRHGNWW